MKNRLIPVLAGVFIATFLQASPLADMRTFGKFNAPEITGAFNSRWSPTGVTDKGRIFSVGFYLKDGSETRPTVLWIGKNESKVIEVRSIGSVNMVLSQLVSPQDAGRNLNAAISIACRLIVVPVASHGQTGFALDREINPNVEQFLSALSSQGLDVKTQGKLEAYLRDGGTEVDRNAGLWHRWWYEVDPVGSIDRVSIRGSVVPMKVTNMSNEIVADTDTVPSQMLRVEKLRPPQD